MKQLTSSEDFSEAVGYVDNDKNSLMHLAVMEPNSVSVSAIEVKKKSVQFVLCDQKLRENILEGLFSLDKMMLVRTNKMLKTTLDMRYTLLFFVFSPALK